MNNQTHTYPAIIIMTRWPAFNRCKKRLANKVGYSRASLIQQKLIEHTFTVAKSLRDKESIEIFIAISGLGYKSARRWSEEKGFHNIIQQGAGNLGLRMKRQLLKTQFNKQKRSAIIIGTDLPTLCERDLIEAIDGLKSNQIVLGPSKDGGYWLIGFSGQLICPEISWPFENIPWGSNKVLEKTILLAKTNNIRYQTLNEHNDIDLIEDLLPWQPS